MENVSTKKYEKVDSFLKRFLPQSKYSGVRLIEPCVAVSDEYDKQFKFVVLANELLYVTENPPKLAKDIQEVAKIVDITSVELINDVPEFLGGDLKYRAHHILVTYKKTSSSEEPTQIAPTSSAILSSKSLQENDLTVTKRNSSCSDGENVSPLRKKEYLQENDLRHSKKNSSSLGGENILPSRRKGHLSKSLQENELRNLSCAPDVSSALRKTDNLSKSLQENDLRQKPGFNLKLKDGYSIYNQEKYRHSLSPILPTRRIRRKKQGSYVDEGHYENDSSLANSGKFQPDQNRLLSTPGNLQEQMRRRSSPGKFCQSVAVDQDSDGRHLNSGKDELLSRPKKLKEKSRRKSSPITLHSEDDYFDHNLYFTNHGHLAMGGPPKTILRAVPTQDFNTPKQTSCSKASDENFDSKRSLPLINYTYIGNEDVDFDSKSGPLHHSFSTPDDFMSKNKDTRLTASAGAADLRALKVSFDPTLNSGSEPSSTSTPKDGSTGSFQWLQNWFKARRGSKFAVTNSDVGKSPEQSSDLDGSSIEDRATSSEIHLYMLLDGSVMLAYLRSTWDNCLLNLAVRFAKQERSPKTTLKNKPNSSQITTLFNQMEEEILNCENYEATFELVHELLTACLRDVVVKKLFWQSTDLLVFMVKSLKHYINEDPIKGNRADQFEFILLLLECLTEMFRETELLSSRMTRLRSKKCSVVRDLVLSCIACPESGKSSSSLETPDISEAAEILLTGKCHKKQLRKKKSSHDIELENLSSELVRHQAALLHELFIIAYQAVWFSTDDKTLNISWMMKIIESPTTVYRYLQVFVQQVMEIVIGAENRSLTSHDATVLYRMLSVLKTFLRQSLKLRRHIHDFYTEEFRYYIKPHAIAEALSQHWPLTPSTLKLVDDVIHLVTDDLPLSNQRPQR